MINYRMLFIILTILAMSNLSNCSSLNKNLQFNKYTTENKCDSIDLINELLQTIIFYDSMYRFLPSLKSDIDYVYSRSLIPSRKTFRSNFKDSVIYVCESQINTLTLPGGWIEIYDERFNIDSTSVRLKVTYLLSLRNYAATTSNLNYSWDSTKCKWVLESWHTVEN